MVQLHISKERVLKTKKTKAPKVPKALEERLGLTPEDRQLLDTMREHSPKDTGHIYYAPLMGRFENPSTLARELDWSEAKVMARLHHIRETWKISEHQPTGNGLLTQDEALIAALTNQERLRWDPEIKDYRIPRIHWYSAEMGTGTEYANHAAFKGEGLVRRAVGANDTMNSYHMQGGIMPNIISMYGKLKHHRALLTGLDQSGKKAREEEFEALKGLMTVAQGGKPNTPKQEKSIREYILNTIDSLPQAAESVAHELLPLVKDIPSHVPIHLFYSYNDDANIDETKDRVLARMRKQIDSIVAAPGKVEKMNENLKEYERRVAKLAVRIGVGDYIQETLAGLEAKITKENKGLKGNKRKPFPTGQKLRDYLDNEVFGENNGSTPPALKRFKEKMRGRYFEETGRKDEQDFKRVWNETKHRYFAQNTQVRDRRVIQHRHETDMNQHKDLTDLMAKTKDEIERLAPMVEQYGDALMAEKAAGISWFTKTIAITSTQVKAMEKMVKEMYKAHYTDTLIPRLQELAGRPLNIKLHTDREITVFVPDPTTLLGKNETYSASRLYGTLVTSVPRTNRQRSNEPLMDSIAELKGKHEAAVANALKNQIERPKYIQEFNKRGCAAFADVHMTGWGSDGGRLMPKFSVAPTRVRGEYIELPHTVWYLKLATRHDMSALGKQLTRGNRGTWEGKRRDKGGVTTGNFVQTIYADQDQEWTFIDDKQYESVAEEFGPLVESLDAKIKNAKTKEARELHEKRLEKVFGQIREQVELQYMLLVNDDHFGAFNLIGRPTNIDNIRTSQIAALQSIGMDRIPMVTGTEFLHGAMMIRSHGYNSTIEGQQMDAVTATESIRLLERGLRDQGYSDRKVLEHVKLWIDEQNHTRAHSKPADQKEMYIKVQKPVIDELMNNGTIFVAGSGNHWNQSHTEDECRVIKTLHDAQYSEKGLLRIIDTTEGQSYSIEPIRLQSAPGVRIVAMMAHKMPHGSTEIGAMMNHAQGHKEDALIYITADRHHPGMVAERERYGVLDVGKQTTMPFVSKIGKASSVRGTSLLGYNKHRGLLFSQRFFLEPIVHRMIDWPSRASVLQENYNVLKAERKNFALAPIENYHRN